MVAFGSPNALAALDSVGALDKKAFAWVLDPPGQTDLDVWESNTSQAIDNLREGLAKFESRLNRELTS